MDVSKNNNKRERSGSDANDNDRPAQRRRISIGQLLNDDSPVAPSFPSEMTVFIPANPSNGFQNLSVTYLPSRNTKPVDNSPPLFPKFMKLPTEIRLMIWKASWEPRDVKLTRALMATHHIATRKTDLNDGIFPGAQRLRVQHARIAKHHWGAEPYASDFSPSLHDMKNQFISVTRSRTRPPVSLWINQESRYETLRHYHLSCGLTRGFVDTQVGQSIVYLNYDLDRLIYPLHMPLSTAFWRADLSRLQRIEIPELTPALPDFYSSSGPWSNDHISPPQKLNLEGVLGHTDFTLVWHLLRTHFPALREINLTPFHTCKRYYTTRESELRRPMNLTRSDRGLDAADIHCHGCFNLQTGIEQNFPSIGTYENDEYYDEEVPEDDDEDFEPAFDPAKLDLDRILDSRGIMQPVFKQETILIGIAPAKDHKSEPEPVTVTFRAIYDGDKGPGPINTMARRVNWEDVKRKCVIRTLERALGPPGIYEYMTYAI